MTDDIIKQIPSIIQDPMIVMESKTVPGRITMFGELLDNNGLLFKVGKYCYRHFIMQASRSLS